MPNWRDWLLISVVHAFSMWIFLIIADELFYYDIKLQIEAHPNPPAELLDRSSSDAGSGVLKVLGWVFTSFYIGIFMVISIPIIYMRKKLRKSNKAVEATA